MAERLYSELVSLVSAGEGNYPALILDDLYRELERGKTPPVEMQLKIVDPDSNSILMSNPDEVLNRHMPSLNVNPESRDTLSKQLLGALEKFGIELPQDHSTNPIDVTCSEGHYQLIYQIEVPQASVSHPDYSWIELVAA